MVHGIMVRGNVSVEYSKEKISTFTLSIIPLNSDQSLHEVCTRPLLKSKVIRSYVPPYGSDNGGLSNLP